jgi:hypothetical protein
LAGSVYHAPTDGTIHSFAHMRLESARLGMASTEHSGNRLFPRQIADICTTAGPYSSRARDSVVADLLQNATVASDSHSATVNLDKATHLPLFEAAVSCPLRREEATWSATARSQVRFTTSRLHK